MNRWLYTYCCVFTLHLQMKIVINENYNNISIPILDLQQRINKYNYLKLVQLITYIAKNVLVDVLKRRLPATNLGFAFNGMKNRILPVLNNQERQILYPDNSYYKGDLSDLDISLVYTILRNLNTLCPHKTGWGNMPTDDDRDMSANIERIRMFKNIYVSHHPTYSLNAETFQNTWTEISACIVELGGTEYIRQIDYLLTSEINPVMETELFNTLERAKEADRQHELHMCNFKGIYVILGLYISQSYNFIFICISNAFDTKDTIIIKIITTFNY